MTPIGLKAIIKIFYYPQSHLAQILTLRQSHCDEIIVTKPLVRGQLTWLESCCHQLTAHDEEFTLSLFRAKF